jgi:predicted alpha/beta-hydrolase family hydrolase
LRFQFPYMEAGSKRVDGPAVAHAAVRAASDAAGAALPLFAGGKSFGGRITSQAQAIEPLPHVRGLVFFGFPLHPAGKPSIDRAQHLSDVHIPMLFLQGTRDALAEFGLVKQVVADLGPAATLFGIPDADHSLHVPAKTGRTDAQVLDAMLDEAKRQLEHTVVRAPMAGVVTGVSNLQPGVYLASATAAFGLVSTESVWVEANPKETELTFVRPGNPVSVTVDTYPGKVWSGTVDSIAPASGSEFSLLPAQNTTGNWVKVVQRIPMRVRLDLSGKPPLRVGMSVVVDVETGHARGLPTALQALLDRVRGRHV